MSIGFEIEGLGDILGKTAEMFSKIDSAVRTGVEKGGKIIQACCKAECPVKTGRLQGSITEQTSGGGGQYTTEIGPTVEYGIYVEMGTGIYAKGGGRQTPWTYKASDGNFYTTHGQPPQPYMEPGFNAGKDQATEILESEVKNAIN